MEADDWLRGKSTEEKKILDEGFWDHCSQYGGGSRIKSVTSRRVGGHKRLVDEFDDELKENFADSVTYVWPQHAD